MDRMEDLPAPDLPISSTLRCFCRLLRSMLVESRPFSSDDGFYTDVVHLSGCEKSADGHLTWFVVSFTASLKVACNFYVSQINVESGRSRELFPELTSTSGNIAATSRLFALHFDLQRVTKCCHTVCRKKSYLIYLVELSMELKTDCPSAIVAIQWEMPASLGRHWIVPCTIAGQRLPDINGNESITLMDSDYQRSSLHKCPTG